MSVLPGRRGTHPAAADAVRCPGLYSPGRYLCFSGGSHRAAPVDLTGGIHDAACAETGRTHQPQGRTASTAVVLSAALFAVRLWLCDPGDLPLRQCPDSGDGSVAPILPLSPAVAGKAPDRRFHALYLALRTGHQFPQPCFLLHRKSAESAGAVCAGSMAPGGSDPVRDDEGGLCRAVLRHAAEGSVSPPGYVFGVLFHALCPVRLYDRLLLERYVAGYGGIAAPGHAGSGLACPGREALALSPCTGVVFDFQLLYWLYDLHFQRTGVFCTVHLSGPEHPAVAAGRDSVCILFPDRRRTVRLAAAACIPGIGTQLQRQQSVPEESPVAVGLAGHAVQSAELSAPYLPGGTAQRVLRHALCGAVLCVHFRKENSPP